MMTGFAELPICFHQNISDSISAASILEGEEMACSIQGSRVLEPAVVAVK